MTVTDPAGGNPLQRIRALQAVSRDAAMLRFTVAEWVEAPGPAQPIWFTPDTPFPSDAVRPDAHPELSGPFAPSEETAPALHRRQISRVAL